MTTIALFDEDAYLKGFKANVIESEMTSHMDRECIRVVLDRTCFFPEQGGQTSDRGMLAGLEVIDVQISEGIISHYLIGNRTLEPGTEVAGEIDWQHRFNNMQQHTGEHIFTGLAHNCYGAENVGFHLSDNTVTLDLDIELSKEQVEELELKANMVIAENAKIKCHYPDKSELVNIPYRSKIAIEGDVRIVEIEGVDFCACCAPHVSTTGQVGMLKVLSFGKYKGGTRIYILCGLRALEDYKRRMSILSSSYQLLNCQEDQIPEKIKGLMEDNKNARYEISQIMAKQLLERVETYPSDLIDVIIFTAKTDGKAMRDGVNALVERHEGLCGIFAGDDEEGYDFIIGSKSRDCGAIAAGLRELLGAKGGGSCQMAQGNIKATRSQIENVI